jgi:hypothetical protein
MNKPKPNFKIGDHILTRGHTLIHTGQIFLIEKDPYEPEIISYHIKFGSGETRVYSHVYMDKFVVLDAVRNRKNRVRSLLNSL